MLTRPTQACSPLGGVGTSTWNAWAQDNVNGVGRPTDPPYAVHVLRPLAPISLVVSDGYDQLTEHKTRRDQLRSELRVRNPLPHVDVDTSA